MAALPELKSLSAAMPSSPVGEILSWVIASVQYFSVAAFSGESMTAVVPPSTMLPPPLRNRLGHRPFATVA